jgi:hypothetical protein
MRARACRLTTAESGVGAVQAKLQQDWAKVVVTNWYLWVPFQFFNFRFVPPKLTVAILPGEGAGPQPGELLELSIHPGQTLTLRVKAQRHDFAERIELGGDDSGRNLPYGLFVDNIGLNGLLIVEGQDERDFFITAAPIAQPCRRLFHLRTQAEGGQTSLPAVINVLPTAAPSR